MARPLVLALLLAALLPGCSAPAEGDGSSGSPSAGSTLTGTPSGETVSEDFDSLASGSKPAGWTTHLGVWGAGQNASDAEHPKVLLGSGQADPGLSAIVAPEG